jgi:hypothetical protein
MDDRPVPIAAHFATREDARKYGNGPTSTSLVNYVAGNITHVTFGAMNDYVENYEWPVIRARVVRMIENHGIEEAISIMHTEYIDSIMLTPR